MSTILTSRRSFITGLVSLVAAPAIVRAGSLMPVRTMIEPAYGVRYHSFLPLNVYGHGPLMDCLFDFDAIVTDTLRRRSHRLMRDQ